MDKVRILIVDDHQLILSGITDMLRPVKHFDIVGSANNGRDAIELAISLNPDVIFMDISMPNMNGIEATKIIAQKLPEVKIIALTQHEESEYVKQILNLGGSGYLLKNSKKEEFVEAIQEVMAGRRYLTRQISDNIISDLITPKSEVKVSEKVTLTRREKEIIQKIADELSNQEIADELYISLRTVETHRRNIMQKLKVKSVVSLIKYAAQNNIIDL